MMQEIYDPRLGERCWKYIHKSGVTIMLYPMEKYSTVSAQLAVKFGSYDTACMADGKRLDIPDGTAHYLEHKLFESPEKDAFALFAETGASCNAGTSYSMTNYYFNCTREFERNLEILLDFVQHPFFTPENVEKERGIITQEINMYQDNPYSRGFTELFKGVYHNNPIRIDIAGTAESIADITDKLLYEVYDIFYAPSNMYLSIAGNFDLDTAVAVCDRCLLDRTPKSFVPIIADEPEQVAKHRTEISMPVGKTQFTIAFKLPAKEGFAAQEDYVYYNLLLDIMFGEASDFYMIMRDKGLINEEFDANVFSGRGFFLPMMIGESDDPDAVLEEIKKTIRHYKKQLPDKEMFSRVKKMNYGSSIRGYGSTENVASMLNSTAMEGIEPFSMLEITAGVTYEEMCSRLEKLDENNCTLSVISPS